MSVRVCELPSGLRVVTHRMETVETVSLGVWVHVGTRFEVGKMNLSDHIWSREDEVFIAALEFGTTEVFIRERRVL